MGIAGHSARKMLEHYSKARLEAKRNAVATLNANRMETLKWDENTEKDTAPEESRTHVN
jgi:hypothetical protein